MWTCIIILLTAHQKMQNPQTFVSDQQYAHQMFVNPSINTNTEYIRVNHIFDEHGKPHDEYQLIMEVHEEMTIQQLKQEYYAKQNLQNSQTYKLDCQKLVYEHDFTIKEEITIKQFKQMINQQKLFGQFLLRLYDQADPYFIKLQSNLNYSDFQKKYKGTAQITLKFHPHEKYIYMEQPFSQTLGQLKQKFLTLLPKQGINLIKKQEVIFKKQVTPEQKQYLQKQYIDYFKQKDGKNYIILSEKQNKLKTRQLVHPGDVIIVQSKNSTFDNLQKSLLKDFKIQIQVYIGDSSQISNEKKKNASNFVIINTSYSKIKSMKVKTLLKQFKVPNFQETSLISQNYCVLKPIQKFKQLEKQCPKLNQESLKFKGIAQNFLFYKQIRNFSKLNKIDKKPLYDLITQNTKKINKNERQTLERKVQQRFGNMKQQSFKQKNFLHPIVLYTSPLIYTQFNLFSRQTSPSQLDFEVMSVKHPWQYPFSQKLIKSLQLIPNYRGHVYRGMKGISFDYKKGDIIQFNSFTSTSLNQKIARKFLFGSNQQVLLKIQTFSGKQIKNFSYYQKEDQVLLFPYTKFKVVRRETINNICQIDLIQIPVPKKIPGDIVVWIDASMKQNYQTFNKIVYLNHIKNLQIIQLNSNDHLQSWIKQYRSIMGIPNVNIHFITNLNRTKERLAQGIDTLKIIRNINEDAEVVFYIGDVKRTIQLLNNKGYGKDEHIKVVAHPKDLSDIICTWKRNVQ